MAETVIKGLPVSVLLCTHKGWSEWVADSVQSILSNDYDTFELIVVDSSPDGFVKRLLEQQLFSAEKRLRCINIDNPEKIKSVALNFAAGKARGELLIFTDDDVLVSPQWIRSYVNAYSELKSRNVKIGAMGGPVKGIWLAPQPSWWPRQWLYLVGEWDFGNLLREFSGGTLPAGANVSFPKKVFLEIGGFDESMGPSITKGNLIGGEDSLCVLKVKNSDRAVYYVPDAAVGHIIRAKRLTKRFFLRRMMREGRSQLAIRAKLAPSSTVYGAKAALDEISRLYDIVVHGLVAPALKGKLTVQTLMFQLGLAAMSCGMVGFIGRNCVTRFLRGARLSASHRNRS
jgi:glucosyl-dolichyl phosphate glucuronosyltransferase